MQLRTRSTQLVASLLALSCGSAEGLAQTGSNLSQQEVQTVLDLHNQARTAVGLQEKLVWDPDIARFAQAWADHIASRSAFEHRPRGGEWAQKYGENLAAHSGDQAVAQGIQLWLAEKANYKGDAISNSNYNAWHYTQMVWQNSRRIGCGKAFDPQKKWYVIVCNYDPPGNVSGQKPFEADPNVARGTPPMPAQASWKENFGPNSGGPFFGTGAALTNQNPFDSRRQQCHAAVYSGTLNHNRKYTFQLDSKDFDAFLRVEDANGREVASDDDGGGGTNSQVKFRPNATGTYKVIVTTFQPGATGNYQLILSSAPADPLPGTPDQPVAKADWEDKGTPNSGGPFFGTQNSLTKESPKDTRQQGSFAKTYAGVLRSDRTYEITVTSTAFDTFLRLEDANGKEVAFNDDSDGTLNSKIAYRPTATGTYRVIVTSFQPGATGLFTLMLRSDPAPAPR